jgi:hypothetical protein
MKPGCGWVRLLIVILVLVFSLQLVSCGYLIYPERRGQTGGHIDIGIAILDGLGLLLYIVPGLVAFAVDFTTGTIYLPRNKKKASTATPQRDDLVVIHVDPNEMTSQRIEEIVSEHIGHRIRLNQCRVKVFGSDRPGTLDGELLRVATSRTISPAVTP